MTSVNKPGLTPSTIIERTWEGIPGAVLCFPVSIGMSGTAATEREQAIALSPQERTERLLDFRMRQIADVLEDAPSLIMIDELNEALVSKQDKAIAGLAYPLGGKGYDEKVIRIREKTRLTKDELEALRQPFPGFPDHTPETLTEVAYEYFNQDDSRGRKTFQLLIEDVIEAYWLWVTPRPTISVSAYTLGK